MAITQVHLLATGISGEYPPYHTSARQLRLPSEHEVATLSIQESPGEELVYPDALATTGISSLMGLLLLSMVLAFLVYRLPDVAP